MVNEKVLCGLARDMEQTGRLYERGAKQALKAMGRFSELIKTFKIKEVKIFATSAVRDAIDGKEFVEKIERDHGLKVQILSGEQEAQFAALGVISAMDVVNGVVGDFGGGSLELVNVDYKLSRGKDFAEAIGSKNSFPIGALRLKSISGNNPEKCKEIIDKNLKQFDLNKKLSGKNFYAVGGGFRSLAKYHIIRTDYPLNVLHQYRVNAQKFLATAKRVAAMTQKRIEKISYFSQARADTLSYTAAVIERIIEVGKPAYIVFSAQGVREGILTELLPEKNRKQDPLIEKVSEMIRHLSPEREDEWVRFGNELYEWMSPLFKKEDGDMNRLRRAACILSRLAWHEHTAYRAEMAFRWVLDSAIPAIDHKGRVFVASCVFHRYQTDANLVLMSEPQTLIDRDTAFRAQVIGNVMNLGYLIAGGAPGILQKVPITRSKRDEIILSPKTGNGILISDAIHRKLGKISTITGLKTKIET